MNTTIININNKHIYSIIVSTFAFIADHSHFEFGLVGGAVNKVALYSRKGKIEFTLC